MLINEINKFDTLMATVIRTSRDSAYLKINELENAEPIVILHDFDGYKGDNLLVSVGKISADQKYIKVYLDSYLNQSMCLVA